MLALRDGELKRHWESVDEIIRTAQKVNPRCEVKEVFGRNARRTFGKTHWINKSVEKMRRRYFLPHSRSEI